MLFPQIYRGGRSQWYTSDGQKAINQDTLWLHFLIVREKKGCGNLSRIMSSVFTDLRVSSFIFLLELFNCIINLRTAAADNITEVRWKSCPNSQIGQNYMTNSAVMLHFSSEMRCDDRQHYKRANNSVSWRYDSWVATKSPRYIFGEGMTFTTGAGSYRFQFSHFCPWRRFCLLAQVRNNRSCTPKYRLFIEQ